MVSNALGTKYIAISDLLDAGSNKMANEQSKQEIIIFHLSILPLVFLVKHIKNLKVATNTDMNNDDIIMFLTRLRKTFSGLHSQYYLTL